MTKWLKSVWNHRLIHTDCGTRRYSAAEYFSKVFDLKRQRRDSKRWSEGGESCRDREEQQLTRMRNNIWGKLPQAIFSIISLVPGVGITRPPTHKYPHTPPPPPHTNREDELQPHPRVDSNNDFMPLSASPSTDAALKINTSISLIYLLCQPKLFYLRYKTYLHSHTRLPLSTTNSNRRQPWRGRIVERTSTGTDGLIKL